MRFFIDLRSPLCNSSFLCWLLRLLWSLFYDIQSKCTRNISFSNVFLGSYPFCALFSRHYSSRLSFRRLKGGGIKIIKIVIKTNEQKQRQPCMKKGKSYWCDLIIHADAYHLLFPYYLQFPERSWNPLNTENCRAVCVTFFGQAAQTLAPCNRRSVEATIKPMHRFVPSKSPGAMPKKTTIPN